MNELIDKMIDMALEINPNDNRMLFIKEHILCKKHLAILLNNVRTISDKKIELSKNLLNSINKILEDFIDENNLIKNE